MCTCVASSKYHPWIIHFKRWAYMVKSNSIMYKLNWFIWNDPKSEILADLKVSIFHMDNDKAKKLNMWCANKAKCCFAHGRQYGVMRHKNKVEHGGVNAWVTLIIIHCVCARAIGGALLGCTHERKYCMCVYTLTNIITYSTRLILS